MAKREDPIYSPAKIQTPHKKNVLLLVVEALRADAIFSKVEGVEVMPTLSALARKGLNFTRAYSHAADTSYSVSAILSGLYPLKFDTRDTYSKVLYPKLLVSDVFRSAGYKTGYFSVFDWPGFSENVINWDNWSYASDPSKERIASAEMAPYINHPLEEERAFASDVKIVPLLDLMNLNRFKQWIGHDVQGGTFFTFAYLYSSHFPLCPPTGIPTITFRFEAANKAK